MSKRLEILYIHPGCLCANFLSRKQSRRPASPQTGMASISNRVYTPQDPISHRGKTAVSSIANAPVLLEPPANHPAQPPHGSSNTTTPLPPERPMPDCRFRRRATGIDGSQERPTLSKKIRKMSAGEKRRRSFPGKCSLRSGAAVFGRPRSETIGTFVRSRRAIPSDLVSMQLDHGRVYGCYESRRIYGENATSSRLNVTYPLVS